MISLVYRNKKILEEIKNEFQKNGIIKLETFFDKSFYENLKEEAERLKFRRKKIAKKICCSEAQEENKIKSLLSSKEFGDFISFLADKSISSISIKRFSHNDYTLLHDSESSPSNTKLLIFICEKWEPDLGGNFVFTKENGKTFYITPMENSVALIRRQKDWREFVQYINHSSKQRKIIIIECTLL